MVKTLKKSSPEPAGYFHETWYVASGTPASVIVCSNDDPGVTLTYFTARSNLVTYAFLWEKVKTVDFSETIAASDLNVGRCRQLIEFMISGERLQDHWFSGFKIAHKTLGKIASQLGQKKSQLFPGPPSSVSNAPRLSFFQT